MTPLIGVGALVLSVAMLVAGAVLVAARTASTRVERFWVGLLVVQVELGVVSVACSLLKALEARAVLIAQVVLLGILAITMWPAGESGVEAPSRPRRRHE